MIVVSGKSHVYAGWGAIFGFEGCDFRDNKVGLDSYFDEADL